MLKRIITKRETFLTVLLFIGALRTIPAGWPAYAQENDKPATEAERVHKVGDDARAAHDMGRALDAYMNELSLRLAARDSLGEAWALLAIGDVFHDVGRHQPALEYFNRALTIFRQAGNVSGQARALRGLALSYRALGQTEESLECFHNLLPMVHASGDSKSEGEILGDIGVEYLLLGYREQGLDYLNRKLMLERAQKNEIGEAAALRLIGSAMLGTGERKKALDDFEKALAICVRVNEKSPNDSVQRQIDELRQEIRKVKVK
jgi:tetratricopeptide (TPR) repeat protein